jgi:hypothetical protein
MAANSSRNKEMRKWITLILLLLFIGWWFIKPATPTHIQVTGQIVDFDTRVPVSDAKVEISRIFNDGTLWVFLRYAYLTETKTVNTNSSGQFRFTKIIKDSRLEKNLWTGSIKVSKERYIPFCKKIIHPVFPQEFQIQLKKEMPTIQLPQGKISLVDHAKRDSLYVKFQPHSIVELPDQADLILRYEGVKNPNDLPKSSQYLGITGGRYLAALDAPGGIAPLEARQSDLFGFFEEVERCNNQQFTKKIDHPGPSVYCVKTKDGKFAKIVLDLYHGLHWVYQPDGTDHLRSGMKEKRRSFIYE